MRRSTDIRSRSAMRRQLRDKTRWPTWAVAVLSAGVSLAVAALGGWFTLSAASLGADEDRAKEAREKNSAVYATYMTAAEGYRAQTDEVVAWITQIEGHSRTPETTRGSYPADPDWTKFQAAGTRCQAAVAELSIYGSEDAWTLHLKMATTMPTPGQDVSMWQKNSHLRMLFLKQYGINDYDGAPPARRVFMTGFEGFQKAACRDVAPQPRKSCGT